MKRGVIFDLDGTLINLPIDYGELFDEIATITHSRSIRPITKTISSLDMETKQRVFSVWERIELKAFESAQVNKEGMELYQRHREEPMALVTMQGKRLAEKALSYLNISISLIITREDSLDRKDQLKTAIGKLGATPTDVLFIGNTLEDANAAKQTGCQFFMVGEK